LAIHSRLFYWRGKLPAEAMHGEKNATLDCRSIDKQQLMKSVEGMNASAKIMGKDHG
jgi:hypothetical protein